MESNDPTWESEPKTQGWILLNHKRWTGHYQREGLVSTKLGHVFGVERKAASYSILEGTSHGVIPFSSVQTHSEPTRNAGETWKQLQGRGQPATPYEEMLSGCRKK